MNNPLNSSDHTGRVVLVTGGTKGIGRRIAAAYAAAGATRRRLRADARPTTTAERAATDGPTFMACDVREPDQVDALVDGIVERFGRLDVVVNNAGGAPWADSATASPRFNERIVALNLLAPFTVAQAANRVMQGQDGRRGHRQHRQRVGHPPVAGHGRLRRGQGRACST